MGGVTAVDQGLSVVGELARLAKLRDQGDVSPDEYDEAKRQVLSASRRAVGHNGAAAPDGGYLLYRLVASWLRRAAAALAVVALLFGLVAGWSGMRYLDVNAQGQAIQDKSIAQGFGLRIPDPRPTIDRAVLEGKAAAYGGIAAVTGVIALSSLVGALFIRPPRPERGADTGSVLGRVPRNIHGDERVE
ncbi:MAG: SHOCT domain-containing protein [Actinomycetota bacterium]|nr:SHOCT domain-containing protein [Actinomycetota bacterium]